MKRNEDTIMQMDEQVRTWLDATGPFIDAGLAELQTKRPEIAANVAALVEKNLGTLEVRIRLQPKPRLECFAIAYDNGFTPTRLFSIKLEPLPADALGNISVN